MTLTREKTSPASLLGGLLMGLCLVMFTGNLVAQDYVWAPDFPVGSSLPAISAQDQDGNLRSFEDLVGENGMLFMLSRSFDW